MLLRAILAKFLGSARVSRVVPSRRVMTSLDYYGIEELLTDEERAARDRTREFVQKEVMPEVVPCHRAGKFPEQLIPRMGALRLFAPYLKEHGCAGLSYTAYGLIMQELGRAITRFGTGLACDPRDPFFWQSGATDALVTGNYFGRTHCLFRLNRARSRFRSRWHGNARERRRRSLHFEWEQMLDRQCVDRR